MFEFTHKKTGNQFKIAYNNGKPNIYWRKDNSCKWTKSHQFRKGIKLKHIKTLNEMIHLIETTVTIDNHENSRKR